jgi:RNA recognition motif-containing protein
VIRIFVGNLGTHCNETVLRSVFETYGRVEEIMVAKNYGLVVMADDAEVVRAVRELSNTSWFLQPLPVGTSAASSAA